ncbi:unnamed protein product [Prorocentrum cordatum]|uniref:Uncharacterized protein n=1 Tax=Prorocentrum cordatum TaxID=2364126 RepID=A0ABN9SF55_9DINO|nr:unnamed protein product [Polarella glacialis]
MEGIAVNVDVKGKAYAEEQEEASHSCAGVTIVYREEVVRCRMSESSRSALAAVGLPRGHVHNIRNTSPGWRRPLPPARARNGAAGPAVLRRRATAEGLRGSSAGPATGGPVRAAGPGSGRLGRAASLVAWRAARCPQQPSRRWLVGGGVSSAAGPRRPGQSSRFRGQALPQTAEHRRISTESVKHDY